jgi:DNA-binding transcriptional LysR family regulator
MMTFKQLEAVYWITELGGFSQAANRLNTAQSAISKRIHELEALFDTEIFDRTQRNAKLTEKGEEMYLIAKKLLEQRNWAVEQFRKPDVIERRIRLGVTELIAMTWLPYLIEMIQRHYPKVIIEPEIDMSVNLWNKMMNNDIDLIIIPDAISDHNVSSKVIGTVENVWMCKAGTMDTSKPIRLHELTNHNLLMQGDKSCTGLLYDRWFQASGIEPRKAIKSNSFLVLLGLTVAGMGLSYLPKASLAPMVRAGILDVVEVVPNLPETRYVAQYKGPQHNVLFSSIVMLAQECCNFSMTFGRNMG